MKVLNLRCGNEHRFEGWFNSDEDFVQQGERGLMSCPVCGDAAVSRLPSAPRVSVRTRDAESVPSAEVQRQALMLRAIRHVVENTEDVGERFADEARRIHYGEAEQRGIRGQASREDADALREEGIEVHALPIPEAAKGPLQ